MGGGRERLFVKVLERREVLGEGGGGDEEGQAHYVCGCGVSGCVVQGIGETGTEVEEAPGGVFAACGFGGRELLRGLDHGGVEGYGDGDVDCFAGGDDSGGCFGVEFVL